MMKYFYLLLLGPWALAVDAFKYSNETNISIIQTGGNTELETYDVKTENTFKRITDELSFGGHYVLGQSQVEQAGEKIRVETARNWDVHARYVRNISALWGGFVGVMVESDQFAGFERRYNYDIGGRYTFLGSEVYTSFLELGYRYTEEFTVDKIETLKDHKGRAYYESSYKPVPAHTYKFWIQFIPNLTRTKDYIVSVGPSLTFGLGTIFSLQVGYKAAYDNEPAGENNEYVDYTFSTSLLAKF